MYPNQNQYSIDYLNDIAPQARNTGPDKKLLAIVVIGVILAIGVGFSMLLGGEPNSKEKLQTLAARLQTLQDISDKAQKNIKSGPLRGTNGNLTIFLTNANTAIADPLLKNGIKNPKKLNKKIVLQENGEELSQKLEDARLNAVFDRTYAREMNYQLATVAALMKDIYTHSNSKSVKEFLVTTDNNLQPIKKQLAEFNAANS